MGVQTLKPGLPGLFGLTLAIFALDRPVAPGVGCRPLSQLRFPDTGSKTERRLDIFYGQEWVGLEKITL